MIASSSYYTLWTVLFRFRVDWCAVLIIYCGDWIHRDSVCVIKERKEDGMDAPGLASLIRAYRQNLCQMRKSNDPSESEPTYLNSLGVLDLDISVCPDPFGLRAFDEKMPITRMLPGSSPCDLRLLISDAGVGRDGFHDVVIENLLGTSVWRSKHVMPADVIGLRQRWPKAVFQVMRERSVEMEDLRRKAYTSGQPAYRYTGRGYCPVCETKSDHLDLGQLWRCPVEWCAVWKGSICECRDHFNEKHSGSETIDFDKVSKAFPAWTVTRDFSKQALKPEISGIAVDITLFRESGRRLVHKYRVYRDPLPHPALWEGKISRLISLANRAMAIAQLTQLRIAIPSSGNVPGEVPIDCFPTTIDVDTRKATKRVSFTPAEQMSTVPIEMAIAEAEETSSVKAKVTDSREASPVPPPGFRPFEWPEAKWIKNGELQHDPGLKFVASWSAKIAEEEMSSPPPLEALSPILIENSQDSMTVQVGTTDSEVFTPIVLDRIRSVHRRRSRRPSKLHSTFAKPAPVEDFLFRDILCEKAQIDKRSVSIPTANKDSGMVPRWRLVREGPFPNERSQASLRVLGKGCTFRHTTYKWEDHARPEGGLGVLLNHPHFLEWLGVPDSAWLLEMSPGHWCDTLSRDQAMTAAMQLHRDACLMQTNLDILDQYALALHGTASKMLQKTIGGGPYPGAEVAAPGTHARRASVQMEALGLWRPTMDPVQFATARC